MSSERRCGCHRTAVGSGRDGAAELEHEGSFLGREAEARAARAEHWHAMMHCRVHGGLVGTVHVSRHDDERGHLAGGNSLRELDIGGNHECLDARERLSDSRHGFRVLQPKERDLEVPASMVKRLQGLNIDHPAETTAAALELKRKRGVLGGSSATQRRTSGRADEGNRPFGNTAGAGLHRYMHEK